MNPPTFGLKGNQSSVASSQGRPPHNFLWLILVAGGTGLNPGPEAKRSGNNFKFVVPVTGKVDDDALAFDLQISEISLTEYGREMRKGSKNLTITFAKKE